MRILTFIYLLCTISFGQQKDLVKKLASEKVAVRKEAYKKAVKLNVKDRKTLVSVLSKSSDPELQHIAKKIQKTFNIVKKVVRKFDAAKYCIIEYQVVKGDTIILLSQLYDSTPELIMQANPNLKNSLVSGSVIDIPIAK